MLILFNIFTSRSSILFSRSSILFSRSSIRFSCSSDDTLWDKFLTVSLRDSMTCSIKFLEDRVDDK